MKIKTILTIILFLVSSIVIAETFPSIKTQVPFGDLVSENIYHYNRQTPYIATSGRLNGKAVEELRWLGFRTVLDLRESNEGVASEKEEIEKSGIVYYNIPVEHAWPDASSLKKFKILVEDKSNYPLLVHCMSGNRVGFMWAIYQIQEKHESLESAILQGQTIGMKSELEKIVRDKFSSRSQ